MIVPPTFPGLVTEGDVSGWAVFSPDRKYRYLLGRHWDRLKPFVTLFLMQNPSKAGAVAGDPTVRKCIGFATRWGFGGALLANRGAYVATHPRELITVSEPVGPHNESLVRWALRHAAVQQRVMAWGHLHRQVKHATRGTDTLLCEYYDLWCLGRTASGEPRHPLMLEYATPLETFHP